MQISKTSNTSNNPWNLFCLLSTAPRSSGWGLGAHMGQCQQGKVTARKEKTKQKPQELMYSFFFFFFSSTLNCRLLWITFCWIWSYTASARSALSALVLGKQTLSLIPSGLCRDTFVCTLNSAEANVLNRRVRNYSWILDEGGKKISDSGMD